jgi:hypothetical protein
MAINYAATFVSAINERYCTGVSKIATLLVKKWTSFCFYLIPLNSLRSSLQSVLTVSLKYLNDPIYLMNCVAQLLSRISDEVAHINFQYLRSPLHFKEMPQLEKFSNYTPLM